MTEISLYKHQKECIEEKKELDKCVININDNTVISHNKYKNFGLKVEYLFY